LGAAILVLILTGSLFAGVLLVPEILAQVDEARGQREELDQWRQSSQESTRHEIQRQVLERQRRNSPWQEWIEGGK
jgi:hypothetical protein